ncbi:MAG: GNAT family N-acetyltransferase [Anaerolineales bacterium]
MDKTITTSRGTIIVRQGQESDAQAYRELRLEGLRNHPEAFSADYDINEKRPLTFWVERMRSLGDENTTYFAIHENDLIGTCGIYRGDSPKTQHSGTIVGVYVRSEWRGLRIADELVAACVEWAKRHEIKIIKLGVTTTNTSAIRCYARCGFTTYGIEPQAIYTNSTMYDELLMARTI